MIGDIRNPWVRRPLVVVVAVVGALLILAVKICETLFETVDEEIGDDVRDSWRGPPKRGGIAPTDIARTPPEYIVPRG